MAQLEAIVADVSSLSSSMLSDCMWCVSLSLLCVSSICARPATLPATSCEFQLPIVCGVDRGRIIMLISSGLGAVLPTSSFMIQLVENIVKYSFGC